jgi:hypothetical protein
LILRGTQHQFLESLVKIAACYIFPSINRPHPDGWTFTLTLEVDHDVNDEISGQLQLYKDQLLRHRALIVHDNKPEEKYASYVFQWS